MFTGFICSCIPGAIDGLWICTAFENIFLGICVYYTPVYVEKFNAVMKTVHGIPGYMREYTMYFTPSDALSAYETICKLKDDIKKYPSKSQNEKTF